MPNSQSSFSQTDVEAENDSEIEKLLEIKGDPTSSGLTTYQIIVSGEISFGPQANPPDDMLSLDGTTIDGTINPSKIDNYFFTGNIISITSNHPIFSFIDGEPFNGLSTEDLRLIEENLAQAKTLFEQRYTESSIFHYEKVLAIDPLNIDALNGKAIALDFVGSHEEAISYFDKVLLIDSKNVDALLGKGFALENLGKTDEAISYFDKVLDSEETQQPLDSEETQQPLDSEETQQPLEESSQEDLELLIEFLEQADELMEEGSFYDAISLYEDVLTIDSSNTDALNGKALALDSLGRHEEAISFYDQVLTIDSSDTDALNGKALALDSLGRHEEAISFYDQVLTIDSSNTDALFGKALTLESLGRGEEAMLNLEQIVELESIEEDVPLNDSGKIIESDQTLFGIMVLVIIILFIIIIIHFFRSKRKNYKLNEVI